MHFVTRSMIRLSTNRLLLVALAVLLTVVLAACGGLSQPPLRDDIPTATPTSLPAAPLGDFQNGVAFPLWGADRYADTDNDWVGQLPAMHDQTRATWVEMIVNLEQDNATDTNPHVGSTSTSPQALSQGITRARRMGFRVLVIVHINVKNAISQWAGYIQFSSRELAAQWFAAYWQAIQPFVAAAANSGADEFGLGNEYTGLESAPSDLWSSLISQAHAIFPGALMYAGNHGLMKPQSWMRDPKLTYLGISAYDSLVSSPQDLTEQQIEKAWKSLVLPEMNQLSAATGKKVLISEVGYHATADALFEPWNWTGTGRPDPPLQAAAYQAAITTARADSHLAGIYIWGWGPGAGPFAPSDMGTSMLAELYG